MIISFIIRKKLSKGGQRLAAGRHVASAAWVASSTPVELATAAETEPRPLPRAGARPPHLEISPNTALIAPGQWMLLTKLELAALELINPWGPLASTLKNQGLTGPGLKHNLWEGNFSLLSLSLPPCGPSHTGLGTRAVTSRSP